MAAAAVRAAVRLEIGKDGIAIIKMVKGDGKWNMPYVNEFGKALDDIERNEGVRCVVITGQGKFFSYGLDLQWIAQQTKEVNTKFFAGTDAIVQRLALFPMPTIAAMNGHAFGQGAIMALACDYRVMRKGRGWFCLPETSIKLKFSPVTLELIRLKLHRVQTLRDAAIFSKRYPAEEALKAEIVDEAVDESELITSAIRYGNEIAGEVLDRGCVAAAKNTLYGIPIKAKREEFLKSTTQKEKDDRLAAFVRGAQILASKM